MKVVSLLIAVLFWSSAFAQNDSTVVRSSPGSKRPIEFVLVVNQFIIYDSVKAKLFLEKFNDQIRKRKLYSKDAFFKKWGIAVEKDVLFCETEKRAIIDMEKLN